MTNESNIQTQHDVQNESKNEPGQNGSAMMTQTNSGSRGDSGETSTIQPHRQERTITPRASVYETQDEVVLELEVPGVNRESINVKVENDELTISANRKIPVDTGYETLHQERLPFNYKRAFILSDRIDAGQIKASCADGVLQLVLPKAAQAKPRQIPIE